MHPLLYRSSFCGYGGYGELFVELWCAFAKPVAHMMKPGRYSPPGFIETQNRGQRPEYFRFENALADDSVSIVHANGGVGEIYFRRLLQVQRFKINLL